VSNVFLPITCRGAWSLPRALLQHHHRRLAVIAGPASSPDNVARLKGFMDELRRHRIDPQTVRTIDSDFSPEGGWVSAKALLASKHRFTALFCANDEMAVGVLSYFQQAGLSVPHEVSVLGYDDAQSAEYSAPRLTSVHIPLREGNDQWPQLPAEPMLRLAPAGRKGIPDQRGLACVRGVAASAPSGCRELNDHAHPEKPPSGPRTTRGGSGNLSIPEVDYRL
jgi:hypothetical protein